MPFCSAFFDEKFDFSCFLGNVFSQKNISCLEIFLIVGPPGVGSYLVHISGNVSSYELVHKFIIMSDFASGKYGLKVLINTTECIQLDLRVSMYLLLQHLVCFRFDVNNNLWYEFLDTENSWLIKGIAIVYFLCRESRFFFISCRIDKIFYCNAAIYCNMYK